eukprot:gnl/MRDRNA2_/MRDRNA2_245511_c0_seq1.p1 gnl/MRDRNA2_/MRDRNA2_245511_c0~~gnl/MRDRNA2_/MRDRNA2_245511_c0_seq1.p1  ORF type:complete len:418 (+),score=46.11 gnl/MRDRNA2_/MRDRNA2_245511_c0_seq1:69-1256(+)
MLTAFSVVHAIRDEACVLLASAFLLGFIGEQLAIRFGGTHCHATSPIANFSDCSSLNSVLWYGPWLYSAVTVAQRLCSSDKEKLIAKTQDVHGAKNNGQGPKAVRSVEERHVPPKPNGSQQRSRATPKTHARSRASSPAPRSPASGANLVKNAIRPVCEETASLSRRGCWLLPFLAGALASVHCGVYDAHSSFLGWVVWPRTDGVVKEGCNIWQFGPLGLDARGLVADAHTQQALSARIYEVPLFAYHFQAAIGWGIACGLLLTRFRHAWFSVLVFGPSVGGLVWIAPIHVLEYFGISVSTSVPPLLLVMVVVPLLLAISPLVVKFNCPAPSRDDLLFSIALLNYSYFGLYSLFAPATGALPIPARLAVCILSVLALAVHARATGLWPWFAAKTS